ncbi:MAG: ribulose-phosphate 3-epimerase [Vicinamibacteria bacterium]|nr:ribulose-phosphate 3-epimerase [Vicinamibacteria bacterium]
MIKIAPSILSADFTRLGEQVREAEAGGADYIHVDVMDGHFVPNITAGPLLVEAVRRVTKLPLDVHLMLSNADGYLDHFARAGASILTVHAEACPHLHRTVQVIRELGVRPGVTINPATPLGAIEEIVEYVDLVLLMTVNPGFGGQVFISSMLDKVGRLRRLLDERGLRAELEVDGGVSVETVPSLRKAGARVFVAGASVFNDDASVTENITALRRALEKE